MQVLGNKHNHTLEKKLKQMFSEVNSFKVKYYVFFMEVEARCKLGTRRHRKANGSLRMTGPESRRQTTDFSWRP